MSNEHGNTVTPGTYTVRATRWHWDTTKDHSMCLALMLRIEGGQFDGREIRGTLYFDTEKKDTKGRTAADRSMEALRGMGLKGELDAIDDGKGGIDASPASAVVEINQKGFPFARYINPSTFSAFSPPSDSAKRAFFEKMRGGGGGDAAPAKSNAPKSNARSAAAPRGVAQPDADFPADDEIPF